MLPDSALVQDLVEVVVDAKQVAGQIVHHVVELLRLDPAPDPAGASDVDQFEFYRRLVVVGADIDADTVNVARVTFPKSSFASALTSNGTPSILR